MPASITLVPWIWTPETPKWAETPLASYPRPYLPWYSLRLTSPSTPTTGLAHSSPPGHCPRALVAFNFAGPKQIMGMREAPN